MIGADASAFAGLEHETHHGAAEQSDLADDRPPGELLDVGRRTRTISPALRRALAARDRQCRFPGCQKRRCDAHHLEHWAAGGATALDNLVLLCRLPQESRKSFIKNNLSVIKGSVFPYLTPF